MLNLTKLENKRAQKARLGFTSYSACGFTLLSRRSFLHRSKVHIACQQRSKSKSLVNSITSKVKLR